MSLQKWKKFSKKHQLLPKSKQVLLALVSGAITPFEIAHAINTHRFSSMQGDFWYLRARHHGQEERRLRQVIYNLKRRKFLAIRKKGSDLAIAITDKGRNEVISVQCRLAPRCVAHTGIIVIFDIPEAERQLRHRIRFFLRECGFRLLQRSVWYCDREVMVPLKDFIQQSGAEPWISVFRALDQ